MPDAAGRRALLTLNGGSAHVTADFESAVAATEGATASAMKELMRRAVLRSLAPEVGADVPVVDDGVLADVLAEFAAEHQAPSRSLLAGGRLEGSEREDAPDNGVAVTVPNRRRPMRPRPGRV